MKNDYTHISIVLDRSGSMQSICQDTIGGFNKFLKDQQEAPGQASFSLIQFDNVYEVVCTGIPISEAKPLNGQTFVPRGSTALLDAIGRMINETGQFLGGLQENERPEKVVFVVITDGEENASNKFSQEKIEEMITLQRDTYKWEFVFLGANQDAIRSAKSYGMSAQMAINYAPIPDSVGAVYSAASENLLRVRSHQAENMSWTADQIKFQDDQVKKFKKGKLHK